MTDPTPMVPVPSVLATPRSGAGRGLAAAAGAIGAAFLASLCCVGPLVFVAFGVGAGLASTFELLRPLFTGLTVALLAVGFYVVYGRPPAAPAACGPDGSCAVPRVCGPGARSGAALGGLVPGAYAAPTYAAPVSVQAPARPAAQTPRTITLAVRGMTCGGCVLGTRTAPTRLPGVTKSARSSRARATRCRCGCCSAALPAPGACSGIAGP